MHFNFSNLFSFTGLFILTLSGFLAYFVYREIGTKIRYFFSVLLVAIGLFVILKDERKTLISKLENNPDTANLYKLAQIYEFEGNITELVRVYMKIIEKNPDDERALLNLSVLLVHTGHPELGLQLAKRVLRINPENEIAKQLIETLMNMKNEKPREKEKK